MADLNRSKWVLKQTGFDLDQVVLNGSKYILGNGYMGYRGTLEEFRAPQLTGTLVAGLYDKVGEGWREPVNAPNGLFIQIHCNGKLLGVLDAKVEHHVQSLDLRTASHRRETTFVTEEGSRIEFIAERFLSLERKHLLAMEFTVQAEQDALLVIKTGIDTDIWDINGPHLQSFQNSETPGGIISVESKTHELGIPLCVAEALDFNGLEVESITEGSIRHITLKVHAGRVYRFAKFVTIFTGNDGVPSVTESAATACAAARSLGYQSLHSAHMTAWGEFWKEADVEVEGDDEAQFALRYSLYHLLAVAPPPDKNLSIPARGLSGQVYKGAIFWDTEMFMVPFFLSALPEIAKNLLMYRYHTLDGARRKAREYGFEGAFYAWESQENGDDACTHFNVSDVFTGRPIRTHFRDKQIHISAAVAYAFWKYYTQTGDSQIFQEGGAEVIFECARFFESYAYYKVPKQRYELLDVVGPDEYHERVSNNAYTNRMVLETFRIAQDVVNLLEKDNPEFLSQLIERLGFEKMRAELPRLQKELFITKPDDDTGIIEQFDGYNELEDMLLPELKKRLINPNEYLGGGNGLATTTQILKQADVVLMLSLFGDEYSKEVKSRNWYYYEPRTEHGSSLSACAYGLVACEIGETERAYPFFLQTATVDLTGKSKQYVGSLYIGGTHPAANGGAWMVAIKGFAGLRISREGLSLDPKLPRQWQKLSFPIRWHRQRFVVSITPQEITIVADSKNSREAQWMLGGKQVVCAPGAILAHRI